MLLHDASKMGCRWQLMVTLWLKKTFTQNWIQKTKLNTMYIVYFTVYCLEMHVSSIVFFLNYFYSAGLWSQSLSACICMSAIKTKWCILRESCEKLLKTPKPEGEKQSVYLGLSERWVWYQACNYAEMWLAFQSDRGELVGGETQWENGLSLPSCLVWII